MSDHPAMPAGLPRELRPWTDGDPDAHVRMHLRPSAWAVLIESAGSLAAVALLALLAVVFLAALGWLPGWGRAIGLGLFGLAAVRLGVQAVVVACRRYAATDAYVLRVSGVLNRRATSLPVARVQHVVLHRSRLERLTGTGTLGFATAGTGGTEVAWRTIASPLARLGQVRRLVERGRAQESAGPTDPASPRPPGAGPSPTARPSAGQRRSPTPGLPPEPAPVPAQQPEPRAPAHPVVIGVAGGIGSGKSELARAFAEAGCLVSDSDKTAREALDRTAVRDRLVEWWGGEILGEGGRVDRKKVASVVFGDAKERERLERLVHPIIRQGRAELIAQAREVGAPAVVIDAPLLFEAGLDAECDAVVFVHAPREVRLARVRETRGWDEAELSRREKVQLPLDAKRERSDYEVVNDADPERLRAEARRILDQILARRSGNGSGAPRPDAG